MKLSLLFSLWFVSQVQQDKDHASVPWHPDSHVFYVLHLPPLSTGFQLLASQPLLGDHCYTSSVTQSQDKVMLSMRTKYQEWQDETLHTRKVCNHQGMISVPKRAHIKWIENILTKETKRENRFFPLGPYMFIWWKPHNLYNLLCPQIILPQHQLLSSLYFPGVFYYLTCLCHCSPFQQSGFKSVAPNQKHAFSICH